MLQLALSVLSASLIFVAFTLFGRFKLDNLQAITFNYFVASVMGFAFNEEIISLEELPSHSWFWPTMALGAFFVGIFNLMAQTSQKIGVSVASVATKMSLVIPVLAGLVLYQESLGGVKAMGVFLALAAVYLASIKEPLGGTLLSKRTLLVLPLLVFLGSGVIDTSIKYIQTALLGKGQYPLFSATVFGAAFLMGCIFLIIRSFETPFRFQFKNLLGGAALGFFNYFSIIFLLGALEQDFVDSGSIFTINNVAIVLLCTLLGITLFKERLTSKNWIGVILAVVSIIMVSL